MQEILDFVLSDPEQIDHGWLILEKDRIYHSKLINSLEYIRRSANNGILVLDERESKLMADTMGSTAKTIRRHIVLQLTYFRFLERDKSTPEWRLKLTKTGDGYLNSLNKKKYFQENVIEKLIFCSDEWAPNTRVRAYHEFNVRPYEIMQEIMPQIGDVLYLNEMAYFVSKIKTRRDNIEQIISLIKLYRGLSNSDRTRLNNHIESVLNAESNEKFGNWRKNNKRNFEFLSMGNQLSMVDGARNLIDTAYIQTAKIDIEHSPLMEYLIHVSEEPSVEECPRNDVEANSGVEGENIVINLLNQMDFETRNVAGSNRGYDIIGLKNNKELYFEVKSSNKLCSPTLTENEFEKAQDLGERYILAVVERVFSNPKTYFIFNPAVKLLGKIDQRQTTSYSINRSNWIEVAQQQIE